jgi:hypothetical protein
MVSEVGLVLLIGLEPKLWIIMVDFEQPVAITAEIENRRGKLRDPDSSVTKKDEG